MDRAQVVAGGRRALARTLHVVRSSDLAIVFCAVVTLLTIWLELSPDGMESDVVAATSTNLANLRTHPIRVLIASVFVVPHLEGLVLVLVMLVALAYAQAWVGRFATLVVAVIGHVGATLFVSVLLVTGLGVHLLPRSIVFAEDVGVSYALAAVLGWLTARVPHRWRGWYVVALVVYFLAPALLGPSFTDAGHASALALGLSLAVLSARSAGTRLSAPPPGEPAVEPAADLHRE